jgi:hypothetical protein
MSTEDFEKLADLMKPVKFIVDSDLEHLRRMDEVKRVDLWNQIEHNQNAFEQQFATTLPRDIMLKNRSDFAFAKLLLAAAAHINNEDTPLTEKFNDKELALVENFERFNIFGDVLSPEDIVDRIARREDIYELINEIYRGQYSDLDRLLDDPKIERDLKYAFKWYYEKRLNKIKKGVQAYVEKYGPIMVVSQVERKVWDRIKQSEKEREQIAQSLRRQIADLAPKVGALDRIDREGRQPRSEQDSYGNGGDGLHSYLGARCFR